MTNRTTKLRLHCRMVIYNQLIAMCKGGHDKLEIKRINRAFGYVQSGAWVEKCRLYQTSLKPRVTCWCKDRRPKRYLERVTWCKHIISKVLELEAYKLEYSLASGEARMWAGERVILDNDIARRIDQDYK